MKIFKLILSVAIVLIVSSCGGRKYDEYAVIETAEVEVIEETVNDNNEENKDDGMSVAQKLEEFKSLPELQDYKSLYEVTDKAGNTFDIYFTKENSVIVTSSNGNIYYCTLSDYTNIDSGYYIKSTDNAIPIQFEGGNSEEYYPFVLKGDWLYANYDYAESNNPKWRLPVERIGGKDMGKGSKKENGSTKVKSTVTVKESRTSSSQKLSPEEQKELEMAERANSIFKSQHDAVYDSYKERK